MHQAAISMCGTGEIFRIVILVGASVVWCAFGRTAHASILGATAELGNGTFVAATASFLADGNDAGAFLDQTIAHIQAEFGYDMSFVGKTDDLGFGPFANDSSASVGYLALDSPTDGPLVLTLKAGPRYAAFLFVEPDIVGFQFNTEEAGLTNPQGKGQGLSHASLFVGDTPPPRPPTTVPEPSSFLLLGGLLGSVVLGRVRRRFSRPA